jgi:hypothetical protein
VSISGHSHTISISGHTHALTIQPHRHTITVSAHKHTITVSPHRHRIDHTHEIKHTHAISDHTHAIAPGIFLFGNPTGFTLKVNGKQALAYTGTTAEIDITSLLVDAATKRIPRGAWHKIEVLPNDLAYVGIVLSVQGFIQSRGDKTL